ncbi:sterol carrier protein domain-containing protein [Streptomyces inhibens]|uniref:sterol carrier protein domain-containing protein n=1 Tax=Streptomyces inhibens TaxID=2293571 RepID=UPI001FD3A8B7|nr:sterol carrier protein domain-containing protein [Streptomyces inhibens]
MVLEAEDAFCPWHTGRYRLSADGEHVSCERTTDRRAAQDDGGRARRRVPGGTTLEALALAGSPSWSRAHWPAAHSPSGAARSRGTQRSSELGGRQPDVCVRTDTARRRATPPLSARTHRVSTPPEGRRSGVSARGPSGDDRQATVPGTRGG